MSITAEIASNIVGTSFERFGDDLIDRARSRVIDVVGCALAGINASGCPALLSLLKEWGGKKEGTILGLGGKLPVHNAALMNSVAARSHDFDPTGALVAGTNTHAHISGTTVPTALAVAEQCGASGKALLTALILGEDLASRVAAASLLNINSGWDSTGTVNVFGAAAVAGKLWGLDQGQMLNALGIAINQMSGTFQNILDYAHTFKLPQGLAAQSGIFGAALARKGFTAPKDALTGKHGYFALYCRTYKLDHLTSHLGERFYAGDTFKPYPCSRLSHAAIECTLGLVSTNAIAPEEIDEIIVSVTPAAKSFAAGQPFRIGKVPQVNAAFSLQYTVASALLRGKVELEHFTEEYIRDPRIMSLVNRIRLVPTLSADEPLGALVKIKTKQGKEYEKGVSMPRGSDTRTPLTNAEKREKFMANAAFSKTLPKEKAEKALAMLERLEEVDNVAKVMKLLTV
jgi:2-methylcitrate dehydratase PrpD